jgi:D-cysteine desulfhydrase family pyridoxal phosphate-dependent enzyme
MTVSRFIGDVPELPLGMLPTPLHPLPRLSAALSTEIWIKRDDCSGLAGGGNKVRKLRFLMADAKAQGADIVLTRGALQSNHARQTAAAAAALGLDCELLLEASVHGRGKSYENNGNLLLDRILGARVRRFPASGAMQSIVDGRMEELRAAGRRPYWIPTGGSTPLGSLGYARAADEILTQARARSVAFSAIFVAVGSCGTYSGLLAGLRAAGSSIPVIGISVSGDEASQRDCIAALAGGMAVYGLPEIGMADIRVDASQVGSGYGQPTQAGLKAIEDVARLDGVLLDPVYTGKAMAGLFEHIRGRRIDGGKPLLFLHTGGLEGLFAYEDAFPAEG